jgi:hypothetical protein
MAAKLKIKKIIEIAFCILLAVFFPPARLLFLAVFLLMNVRELWIMAFTDPHTIDYERKTDKELYVFLLKACVISFIFAVITFQIFIFIAILYWFYFTFFMIMFSRIWKFHGKSNLRLFAILIIVTATSFITAPFVRAAIPESFIFRLIM